MCSLMLFAFLKSFERRAQDFDLGCVRRTLPSTRGYAQYSKGKIEGKVRRNKKFIPVTKS